MKIIRGLLMMKSIKRSGNRVTVAIVISILNLAVMCVVLLTVLGVI